MCGTLFFSAMKTILNFSFVADKLVFTNTDSSIVVTKEENVVSNKVIAPCNHEEADTHMFLHAKRLLLSISIYLANTLRDLDMRFTWVFIEPLAC